MQFREHCAACERLLGDSFEYVHLWLDEFFGQAPWGTQHRKFRHHRAGIQQVREMWGGRAAEAAKIHILDDIRTGECATFEESDIPADEADYIRRGYW